MNAQIKITDSLNSLRLLQEIERDSEITQRYLAGKLKISLGKINYLINALVDKGIVEIKNFKNSRNKLAYKYLLTPEGLKIKLQLTREFFAWKMEQYERLKEEIESLKKEAAVEPREEALSL